MPNLILSGTPTFPQSGGCTIDAAGNDRVLAPGSVLDDIQGWVATRILMGYPANGDPHGGLGNPIAFYFGKSTTERISVSSSTVNPPDVWVARRQAGADVDTVSSAVQVFAAGDVVTVVVAWEAERLRLAIDGAPFLTVPNVARPGLVPAGTLDIGSAGTFFTPNHIMSTMLWVACGGGQLDDGDSAYLAGLVAPAFDQLPAEKPTFLWSCRSAEYQVEPPRTLTRSRAFHRRRDT
jgi:hypothetical protein